MFDFKSFRELRKNKKIKLKQVANAIGRSGRTIINWEKGFSEPNEPTIKLLADSISVPVSKISDLKDDASLLPSSYENKSLPREDQNIVEFLKMTDNQKLKAILELRKRFEVEQYDAADSKKQSDFMTRIINSVDICISLKDTGLRYIYVNDYFLKYYGVKDRSNIIGRRSTEVFAQKEYWADVEMSQRKVLETGEYIDNKLVYIPMLADMKRIGLMDICAMNDEKGKASGVLTWVVDITGIESSRKQLSYIESALENVDEAIQIFSITDKTRLTIYVNRAVTKIYGVEKSIFYENPETESRFVLKEDRKSYDEHLKINPLLSLIAYSEKIMKSALLLKRNTIFSLMINSWNSAL